MFKAAKCPIVDFPSFGDDDKIELVDQTMSQPFNINEFGHISNDISALLKAQTMNEFNAILARLPENKSVSEFEGMSDEEIIRHIMPPKFQDPVELTRFFDYMASVEYDKISEKEGDVKEVVKESVTDKEIIENA